MPNDCYSLPRTLVLGWVRLDSVGLGLVRIDFAEAEALKATEIRWTIGLYPRAGFDGLRLSVTLSVPPRHPKTGFPGATLLQTNRIRGLLRFPGATSHLPGATFSIQVQHLN
jgi:hypothetical protein